MNDDEALIDAYFDGELSPAEARRLEAWLAESSDRRRLLAERALDHLLLRDVLVSTVPLADEPPASRPALRQRLWQAITRPTPLSLTAAALVMGLLVTAMAYVAAPIYWRMTRQAPVEACEPVIVAQLINTYDAQWFAGQVGTTLGAFLQQGQCMQLQQGLAEIELRGGARVVLEGPATLVLNSASQVELQRGRLTARVGEQARGFEVATSSATFVDLGTEFGVAVRDDNFAELFVFEGVVEARVPRAGGDIVVQRVTQNRGMQIDAVRQLAQSISISDQRFVRQVPKWLPIPIVNASFEEPGLSSAQLWRGEIFGWQSSLPDNHGVSRFGVEFSQATPNGAQLAFLNAGELSQQLTETLAPDTTYRLSVWVGNRPGANSPNYSVELWAGDTRLAASENEVLPEKGRFGAINLTYTSPAADAPMLGLPLKIVLRSHGSLATGTQNHFDHLSLWQLPPTVAEEPNSRPSPSER